MSKNRNNTKKPTEDNAGSKSAVEEVTLPLVKAQLLLNHVTYAWNNGAFLKESNEAQMTVLRNIMEVSQIFPPIGKPTPP